MPTFTVRSGKGKPNEKSEDVEFQDADTLEFVKLALLKRYSKSKPVSVLAGEHNCAVLKLTFPDGTDSPLADDAMTVKELFELPMCHGAVLDFKNVGAQISYRGVFIIEYLGPILLMLLLYSRPAFVYGAEAASAPWSLVAQVGVFLWCLHFAKRELETVFVHKFSRETMPLTNLFKNCAHYWLAALYVGYPLCSPAFEAPAAMSGDEALLPYFVLPAFAAAQWLNFAAHLYFSTVRTGDGDQRRPMPTGPLFAVVSCPNYTAEVLIWCFFSWYTGLVTAWLFTFVGCVPECLVLRG